MFGVTTQCCTAIRDRLALKEIEPLTFHATVVGGRSMEASIRWYTSRRWRTSRPRSWQMTWWAEMLACPERLTAAASVGIPQVVSLGRWTW